MLCYPSWALPVANGNWQAIAVYSVAQLKHHLEANRPKFPAPWVGMAGGWRLYDIADINPVTVAFGLEMPHLTGPADDIMPFQTSAAFATTSGAFCCDK